MTRAPTFWWRASPTTTAWLLAPLGWLYGLAARLRYRAASPMRAGVPVICVGNFTAGGAGKTPTALAVAKLLKARGENPVFLTRGYKGQARGPLRVVPDEHTAADVGDEPLLLAAEAATIVAGDRQGGARMAVKSGASVIVMDDGMQNPALAKDLTLAVVDGKSGAGNGQVMPAGPLRAPLATQLGWADALVIVGDGDPGERIAAMARRRGLPILHAVLVPREPLPELRGKALLAYAGIAHPEKFFESVEAAGGTIARRAGFPDHHLLAEREARDLLDLADREGLVPITTEKDRARLGAGGTVAQQLIARSLVLAVEMAFVEAAELGRLVDAVLARR